MLIIKHILRPFLESPVQDRHNGASPTKSCQDSQEQRSWQKQSCSNVKEIQGESLLMFTTT